MPTHTTVPPVEAAAASINALLTAIAAAPTAVAAAAYRAAIAQKGRDLLRIAGPEALTAALAQLRADAPDKAAAEAREATVREAWRGLMQDRAA